MLIPKYHKLIQIVVTHKCPFKCCHCSQLVPHQPKPFTMSLDEIENALKTLENYPGHIGMFGGEPLTHPQFPEICELYRKYIPVKARRELWTMGYNFDKYRDIINETFYPELVAYNEHEEPQPCWHQPMQIAIEDVFNGSVTDSPILDKRIMKRIINNCWVNNRWSAAVTPMGAYFCEVSAARAMLLGYPEGIPVTKDWWKKPAKEWKYQQDLLCTMCSACLPMETKPNDKQDYDDVSSDVLSILKMEGSPWAKQGKCKVADLQKLRKYYRGHSFTPQREYRLRGGFSDFENWTPWNYRPLGEKKHCPEDIKRR